jgi:hypothetical protein
MFTKNNKKAVVKFNHESEGFSGNTTSFPLKDGQLLEHLKDTLERHGELVIQYITSENEIHVTNSRSKAHTNVEERISEINELIREFAKGRAYDMDAHAVFVDGKLKGVFGNESHAELKRKNLISKGHAEESVLVKPIQINSFEDFE